MIKTIEKIIPRPEKPGMVGDGFRVLPFYSGAKHFSTAYQPLPCAGL
jgi:hypothetical protein